MIILNYDKDSPPPPPPRFVPFGRNFRSFQQVLRHVHVANLIRRDGIAQHLNISHPPLGPIGTAGGGVRAALTTEKDGCTTTLSERRSHHDRDGEIVHGSYQDHSLTLTKDYQLIMNVLLIIELLSTRMCRVIISLAA